eukprot:746425-Hanusia_phi.AAC.1
MGLLLHSLILLSFSFQPFSASRNFCVSQLLSGFRNTGSPPICDRAVRLRGGCDVEPEREDFQKVLEELRSRFGSEQLTRATQTVLQQLRSNTVEDGNREINVEGSTFQVEFEGEGGKQENEDTEFAALQNQLSNLALHEVEMNGYLHMAAKQNDCDLAIELLEGGADPNFRNSSDDLNTPLHVAAEGGSEEMVKILLKYGASVDALNDAQDTPLLSAASGGGLKTDSELLEWSLNGSKGEMKAYEKQNRRLLQVFKVLIDAGADVNHKNKYGNTALHKAAANGYFYTISYILSLGVKVNQRNMDGTTPLHLAAYSGNLNSCMKLVAGGADVNIKDDFGKSPLRLAKLMYQMKVLDFLSKVTTDKSWDAPVTGNYQHNFIREVRKALQRMEYEEEQEQNAFKKSNTTAETAAPQVKDPSSQMFTPTITESRNILQSPIKSPVIPRNTTKTPRKPRKPPSKAPTTTPRQRKKPSKP